MDEKAIIDQVTKEVISFLGREGAVRTSTPSGCAVLNGQPCNDCGLCVTNRRGVVDEMIAQGACRISSHLGIGEVEAKVGHMIDHTLLKPDATEEQIRQLCGEAATYCFASVCVNSCWVELCAQLLRRSGVAVCSVIGFPLGACTTETKAFETRSAIGYGANEIDMVINIGELKSKNYRRVKEDIQACVRAKRPNVLLKVIIEACLLGDEEKVRACELVRDAGAEYVKTSTGFSSGGATLADVALMRKVVGADMGVKAAGGVHSLEEAEEMIKAGASRIGASASLKIIHAAN